MNRKLKITAALLLSSGSVVVSRATNWRQASGPASMASSSIDSRQKGGSRMRLAHLRLLFVTAALGVAALAILVSGPGASGVRQSQAKLSPQAALDWNVIAVNTVRSATLTPAKFQMEGTLYMAYVQAAEYNAVMAISGRYAPYRSSLQADPGRLAARRGRSRRVYDALLLLPDARPVARVGVQRLPERDAGTGSGEGETGRGRRRFGGREPVDRESVR